MSEVSGAAVKNENGRRKIATIVGVAIAALAVFVVAVLIFDRVRGPAPSLAAALTTHDGPLAAYAKGSMAKLQTWGAPKGEAATAFNDASGKPINLAQFKGKVLVVNVWATWCVPCRIEMPTLAALQKRYAGTDLVVLPVSVDRPDYLADAKSFIGVHEPLMLFNDPNFALPNALALKGLPSTVIYDRRGREVARLAGEAKWDTPETYALMDALLKR